MWVSSLVPNDELCLRRSGWSTVEYGGLLWRLGPPSGPKRCSCAGLPRYLGQARPADVTHNYSRQHDDLDVAEAR